MKQIILKYKYHILGVLILAGIGYFAFAHSVQPQKSNPETANISDTSKVDPDKLMNAIRQAEAGRPQGIETSPTQEQIYNNPFVKHIRVALNGYLDGTNKGIDDPEYTINGSDSMPSCGLGKFDKSYYKSKFVVYDAGVDDYGGVQADIVFVDKPDILFWAWVYQLATDTGEGGYTLRGFCKSGPPDDQKEEFSTTIKELIKTSKFSL